MRPQATRAALVLVTIAAVAGAGLVWADQRGDDAPTTWSSTGLPYLERGAGGIVVRFGDGAYAVAEASTSPHFDLRVQSIAATRDSAIAALAPPGRSDGRTRLVEVPVDGGSRTLAGGVFGMALADPSGHLAAWIQPVTEKRWQVVAYDTERRSAVATLDVPPGSSVAAVDGRQVYLYVEGDDPDGVWSVDANPTITPLPAGLPGDKFILDASADGGYLMVVDTGTVLYDLSGRVAHEFGADLFGTFDANGTWMALVSLDGDYHVREVATGEEVRLDLPDGVSPLSFRWAPEGDLVVKSFHDDEGDGDGVARYDSCAVPAGGCTALGELPAEVAERFESSAWGQAMLTRPSD